MLVQMRRVDIIAPRQQAGAVLRSVHRAGVVHLAPFEPPESVGGVFGAERAAGRVETGASTAYAGARRRVGELAEMLGRPEPSRRLVADLWDIDDEALVARVDALGPVTDRASELSADIQRLRGEAARLAGYRQIIEGLRRVIAHLPSVRGYGSTGIVMRSRYRSIIGLIREELEALTGGRCEVLSADLDADRVAAVLIYPLRQAAEVRTLVGSRDLEEVTLPESLAAVPFDELVPRLRSEEQAIEAREADVDAELKRLAGAHGPLVAALGLVLDDRLAEAGVLREAGGSDHLVVISGWLPADAVDAVRARLAADVGPEAVVVEHPGDPVEAAAPVALTNRPIIRAFEPLSSFVSLPRYGTIDPTPVVAFVVPLFVGLMVGDAGYGLVLLALLGAARWRWQRVPAVVALWPVGALAALATIGFGVLFGEWFGDLGHTLFGLQPVWFDRREGVTSMLVLALGIGVAQIGFGLVLGIVNAARLRHRREAVARVALLGSLGAILATLLAAAGYLPASAVPAGIGAIVIGLVVLAATLGLNGPLEMMGVIGNVLSYARLMAIGLASVMLALIANRMGGLVESALIGIVIAVVFHVLAFGLGFFDASVQGLRLQYVEFFSKFAEPSGVRYQPFVSVLGARRRAFRTGT
jgi:V/A-type H+-transporting ATPase subunit I